MSLNDHDGADVTIDELIARLQRIGFLCVRNDFEKMTRIIVAKLTSTQGNRIDGEAIELSVDEDGKTRTYEVDDPCPEICFYADRIEWFAGVVVLGGRSPGSYEKLFTEPAEVYEEVLHYFFDAHSPMSVEAGFVPGAGRPSNA